MDTVMRDLEPETASAPAAEARLALRIRPAVSAIPVIAERVARAVRVIRVPAVTPAGGER